MHARFKNDGERDFSLGQKFNILHHYFGGISHYLKVNMKQEKKDNFK